MFRSIAPDRLDRPAFWVWVVPLVLGHVLLTFMMVSGAKGFGAIDTLLVLFYARVLGSRFRDIGWPGWIAPTFVIVTMIVIPLLGLGIAIGSHTRPDEFMNLISSIGSIMGPANLLLMVVAGVVPGRERDDPAAPLPVSPETVATGALPAPGTAISPPSEADKFSTKDALVVGGGALAILLIVYFGVSSAINSTKPRQQASSPPSPVPWQTLPRSDQPVQNRAEQQNSATQQMQVESNGLTKYTNDFLRQLQQSPANRR